MNLKVNNVTLTLEQAAGSSKAILIEAAPDRAYKDGKATDTIIGTRYRVVCPDAKYVDFPVKVPGPQAITQEEIDAADAPIEVSFKGFVGRFYRPDGAADYAFTSRADSIVTLSKPKA